MSRLLKVTTRGHEYSITVKGCGPAVLFIHGFPDSSELWKNQVDAFSSAGFMAVAPDMLGYGLSDKPQEPNAYKLRWIAEDMIAILKSLQISKAHVVGHDWGAAVAWRLALSFPAFVCSLTALSVGHPGGGAAAGGIRQRASMWYFLFFQYAGIAEECLSRNDWQLFREFLGAANAEAADKYVTSLSRPGALTAALNWYRANFKADLFGEVELRNFPKLNMPVMGIWSTADAVLLEQQMVVSGRWVATGKWRYERLEGVGHWIPRDAPEQLSEILMNFVTPTKSRL